MISVDHHVEEGESSGDADRGEEEDVASNIMFVVVIVTSAALRSS